MDDKISFMLAQEVKQIFEGNFDSKYINCFSHSRIFSDGSRAELWTDIEAMKHTHVSKRYTSKISHAPDLYDHFERYLFLKDVIDLFDAPVRKKYCTELEDQKNIFNHDNTFLVSAHDGVCHEYFCFYGPSGEIKTKMYLINHLEKIETFISKYKHCAKHIIKRAEEDRLIHAWIKSQTVVSPILTRLEKDIGQLTTYGYSNKKIANILGKGVRTVESYLLKLRDKYRVVTKEALIVQLRCDPMLFDEGS